MQAVANAYAAAVMDAYPGGAASRVNERVQDRPIRDGIRAILHPLRLPIWRRYRASVEMVSTDDDGAAQLAFANHVVETQAQFRTLAVSQPANARRQSLELHFFSSQANPTS